PAPGDDGEVSRLARRVRVALVGLALAGGASAAAPAGAAPAAARPAVSASPHPAAIAPPRIAASAPRRSRSVAHAPTAALDPTNPQLRSTWLSSTYWRMAAIAAVLTLPFLFAAAIQALIRSDLALLLRAAFGYLPLAMLAIAIVAPVTTLLLAASDEMCSWISSAAGNESAHFLTRAGAI